MSQLPQLGYCTVCGKATALNDAGNCIPHDDGRTGMCFGADLPPNVRAPKIYAITVGPRMRRRFAEPPGHMTYTSDIRPTLSAITEAIQELAQLIAEGTPTNREQELALEALEIVQMRSRRTFDRLDISRTTWTTRNNRE